MPTIPVEKDDVIKAIRDELPPIVAKQVEEGRRETHAKIDELDKKIDAIGGDFKAKYAAALGGNGRDKPGLIEQRLTMEAGESVEAYFERQRVPSGRITSIGSGAARGSGGQFLGLAGVRDLRGVNFARFIRALGAAERKTGVMAYDAAAEHAQRVWGDGVIAEALKTTAELVERARGGGEDAKVAQRSLGTVTVGNGAGFVLPEFSSFFVDYNFSQTVVRALGAMSITINNEMRIPFIDTAASGSMRDEATGPNATAPTEGFLSFVRKLFTAICPVTNEWLDEASYGPDVFIRNHLSRVLASLFDLKALRGRGASSELRGFDYWVELAGTSHYFNRTKDSGTSKCTFKTTNHDLLALMQAVSDENIDFASGRPGYALPNREVYGLMRILSGTALELRPYLDEMRGGTLNGVNYRATTQIPLTQAGDAGGTGTNNKGNIYFADWSTFAIGESQGIQIEAMRGAAYKDANGTTQPGFTNNETVFKADMRADTAALQRGKELARLDSTDIGVEF
jgi:HK97 family phage major capsid protein